MTSNPYRRPPPMTVRRGLVAVVSALAGAAILAAAGESLPTPPVTAPGRLTEWWRTNGTVVATFSIVRLIGLALSGYLAALGITMTVAAATRWSWADELARRCASAGVRRLIIGGGLAAGLSVSSAGSATSGTVFEVADLGPSEAEFELRDDGPALQRPGDVDPTPRRELGPKPPGPPAPTDHRAGPPDEVETEETWVVQAGDHLWSIAAETVDDRGGDNAESTIAEYWLRLIERNRDVVGDNPDLIHPGQVIILPD